jgi:hypothetical protein
MSEVKVNKISPRTNCGTVTLGDSGDSFAIATCASFKTKDVKDTSGNIIISRCGSNITIGSSGAAVALAAGATQSGFGRTGTVNWDTTKITADPNPAVSGVGYFADTTSSAFTVTLPAAPSAGDIVALSDYTGTWGTNNLTVGRNSSNINGAASDLILNANNTTATLIYVDGTEGWRVIDTGSLSEVNIAQFIVATGGTITCDGDYKIHTFTGPGTFTVTSVGNSVGSDTVDYLVVAGGGAGGYYYGSGGGAGGFRESVPSPAAWTASPLANPGGALPVSVQGYPIVVGAGGSCNGLNQQPGNNGNPSVFSTITSTAGGGGAGSPAPSLPPVIGNPGGSGGGSSRSSTASSGNTPPVSPPQGQPGGISGPDASAGGGATVAGSDNIPGSVSAPGGAGAGTAFNPSPSYGTPGPSAPLRYFAGGGASASGGSVGGVGGGGSVGGPAAGATNTGGGGAGNTPGRSGGSGIVIIRYKYQ